MRVTIHYVAARAGVSINTVSRVVNGGHGDAGG
jgi:DNA-binding LacI/PurR family transcriptional regulator